MHANEYQQAALRTAGTGDKASLLLNGTLGLAGEAGEVADTMKKHLFQGHALNKKELALELGDIAWYLAVAAHALGYGLDDIFAMNVEKLQKRYPNGFSTEASLNREE